MPNSHEMNNHISTLHAQLTNQIVDINNEIHDIKNTIDDEWYCELKRKVQLLSDQMEQFNIELLKVLGLSEANTTLINIVRNECANNMTELNPIHNELSDLRDEVNIHHNDIDLLLKMLRGDGGTIDLGTIIQNYITNHPEIINNTEINLLFSQQIAELQAQVASLNTIITELNLNDFILKSDVFNMINVIVEHDFSNAIWKGLTSGYRNHSICNK